MLLTEDGFAVFLEVACYLKKKQFCHQGERLYVQYVTYCCYLVRSARWLRLRSKRFVGSNPVPGHTSSQQHCELESVGYARPVIINAAPEFSAAACIWWWQPLPPAIINLPRLALSVCPSPFSEPLTHAPRSRREEKVADAVQKSHLASGSDVPGHGRTGHAGHGQGAAQGNQDTTRSRFFANTPMGYGKARGPCNLGLSGE